MNRLPLAIVAALSALAAAAPASAAPPPRTERTLPNVDRRPPDRGPVRPASERARAALARRLGDNAVVSTDRVTGALRLVARRHGFLTARRQAEPAQIALDYVRAHRDAFGLDGEDDLDALRLTSRYRSPDGVTHLAYVQTYGGIAAYDNTLLANIDDEGRLLNIGGAAVDDLRVASVTPDLDATAALGIAKREVGGAMLPSRARPGRGPERPTTFSNRDSARLALFNDGSSTRLGWLVQVTGQHDHLYEVVVDAHDGEVLKRRSLTHFLSRASVHRNHPGAANGGAAEVVDLSADPTWLSGADTNKRLRGQNAHAYADDDGRDGFTSAGEDIPASSGTDWTYPVTPFGTSPPCPLVAGAPGCTWDPSDSASKAQNRAQATTQLFYLVNRMHDHLKAPPIGFTPAARNFEGGDALDAEANDSDAMNNASMSTPPDGASPWMEMHLFGPTAREPNVAPLNSSDAADIVYHEYVHGFTSRSVGSGRGIDAKQSSALGEGWSDWYALDFLVGDGLVIDNAATDGELQIGEYLIPGGFRWQGVDCRVGSRAARCPAVGSAGSGGFTLGDMSRIGPFEVHDVGEIWAQTLWDLRRALASKPGAARALVTGGLRLAPDDPSFIEARDAILQADAALGGTNRATLWQVFAARGMGHSATTTSSAATTATEAFDLPPDLRPAPPPAAVNRAPSAANDAYATSAGTALRGPSVLANDGDPDGDALTASLVSAPANGTLALAADGTFTYTPAAGFAGTDAFTYRASDSGGLSATAAATVTVTGPAEQRAVFPAKLQILRAGVRDGRLDVYGRITARASGRVQVVYHSSGSRTRFSVPIVGGRISFKRRLSGAQRRKTTGILTLSYEGNDRVRPDDVRLRAANGKARLERGTTRIDRVGRLRVSGTISRRARGVVRIRLGYAAADGSASFLRYSAKIRNGSWSLTRQLPQAARAGGQLSIQFTGYEPALIRGEQLAKAVAP